MTFHEDDTPTTSFALPPADAATRVGAAGAGWVSAAFRGADQVGAVVSTTGREVARQVRAEVSARRPGAPGEVAELVAAPSPRPGLPAIPLVALLTCVVGIVGMTMPVVDLAGVASFAVLDVPYVGLPTTLGFVLLTLLPVIDVVQRRVRWTSWLLVPAVVGLVPVGLLLFAMSLVPGLLHLIWDGAPKEALEVGAASMTLGGADVALVVLGFLAILVRVRTRWSRGRRAGSTPPA